MWAVGFKNNTHEAEYKMPLSTIEKTTFNSFTLAAFRTQQLVLSIKKNILMEFLPVFKLQLY